MQKISIFTSFFLLILFSCSRDMAEPAETNCMEAATYEENIRRILDTNCSYAGCHNGSGAAPGNYTFYDGIEVTFKNSDAFVNRAVILKDMPPDYATGPTQLEPEDFERILCWIESGFPEN